MARILSRYVDPLDQIWISAAAQLQLHIHRSSSAYASYDGRGTITIASSEFLDSDDCLAQLVLHELCHGLVEGESSYHLPDWGLDRFPPEEAIVREHACQRTQAALLRPYGLDRLLAPTTEFRVYYDALAENPLHSSDLDAALALAQTAIGRSRRPPYFRALHEALQKTATLHRLMEGVSVSPNPSLPSLWQTAPPPKLHPSGFPISYQFHQKTCSDCVWVESKQVHGICKRQKEQKERPACFASTHAACVLFEEKLDCQDCAACCQGAYDLVPIRRKDEIAHRAPAWVIKEGPLWKMKRNTERNQCAALTTRDLDNHPYSCQVYGMRPTACRDLKLGSAACLIARQRLGLCL